MNTAELKKLAEAATPGPWVMWTSCSWRRLKNAEGVGVCVPFVNRVDKHPDMEVSSEDSAFMEAANPAAILKLLEINAELVEALRIVMACAGDISAVPDGLLEMALDDVDEETREQANAFLVARAALAKAEGGEL